MQADAVAAALAQAHRSEWAFVLSATVRVAGDLDVAEECAQEAVRPRNSPAGLADPLERPPDALDTFALHSGGVPA